MDRYSVILGDGGGNRQCVPTGLSGVGSLLLGPVYKEREGYPCARVTPASRLKLVLVYKQISQMGLPYHLGQFYQLF